MADLVYALVLAGFAGASVWLSIIDFREQRLPNQLVWPLNFCIALGLGIHSLLDESMGAYLRSLFAAAVCFGLFFIMRFFSPSSLGFGDVKLSIAIGLILGYSGWWHLVSGIFIAFISAAVFALFALAAKKLSMKGSLAFGPFMLLGAWIALFI